MAIDGQMVREHPFYGHGLNKVRQQTWNHCVVITLGGMNCCGMLSRQLIQFLVSFWSYGLQYGAVTCCHATEFIQLNEGCFWSCIHQQCQPQQTQCLTYPKLIARLTRTCRFRLPATYQVNVSCCHLHYWFLQIRNATLVWLISVKYVKPLNAWTSCKLVFRLDGGGSSYPDLASQHGVQWFTLVKSGRIHQRPVIHHFSVAMCVWQI